MLLSLLWTFYCKPSIAAPLPNFLFRCQAKDSVHKYPRGDFCVFFQIFRGLNESKVVRKPMPLWLFTLQSYDRIDVIVSAYTGYSKVIEIIKYF